MMNGESRWDKKGDSEDNGYARRDVGKPIKEWQRAWQMEKT